MLHRPKHACVTRNLEGTECQVMRPETEEDMFLMKPVLQQQYGLI